MDKSDVYEIVVGLEVHAQLQTSSKLFCGDSTEFGNDPNTQVSPITLAHPGTLPKMNRKAIEFAVQMGLACNCHISTSNYFARKNYFYPDLPKGYQVSQHTTPVCTGGYITLVDREKNEKQIQLNRIHLEEDAGKSIHDLNDEYTLVDLNRAGTPLIEIVSEPDIRSGEEAFNYLVEIRKLVRYLGICDGNMEEGSLRCDANISVRTKGDQKLGTRVEVKNLNSMRHVRKAIDYEATRLIACMEDGIPIIQQTRSFNASNGTTFSIRDKEEADDYRYFPEPDLSPFELDEAFIAEQKARLPVFQRERVKMYVAEYGLSAYDATLLTEEKDVSDYFDQLVRHTTNYKSAANWIIGPVKTWLNSNNTGMQAFPVLPGALARLQRLTDDGKLSFTMASTRVFEELLKDPSRDPEEIAVEKNLFQQSDVNTLEPIIDRVLEKYADKVKEYRMGKKGVLSLFVGEVMKQSKGKADPKLTNQLILEKLKS
jgi:aspartyl-tRNA(Asn)/glutamyl-tRNA(Gln) amidotransferase subunit B